MAAKALDGSGASARAGEVNFNPIASNRCGAGNSPGCGCGYDNKAANQQEQQLSHTVSMSVRLSWWVLELASN